ncbi:MAG: MMPL family transporter [Bacteroidota bacterium]
MLVAPRYRRPLLFLVLVISLIQGVGLSGLKVDFELEALFPQHDPDLAFYQKKLTPFSSDESFLVLGLPCPQGVFNSETLPALEKLRAALQEVSWVRRAHAITDLSYFTVDPFFRVTEHAFTHLTDPATFLPDSIFLASYPDVEEKFIAASGLGTAIYLNLAAVPAGKDRQAFLATLEKLCTQHGFPVYHLSGALDMETTYEQKIQQELILLSSLSLMFIVVVLWSYFRSFSGVLLPLLIILLAVSWTLGTLSFFGGSLNTLTVLTPSIIAIVSLSDVIHLMNRFQEELVLGEGIASALHLALGDIGKAIFLTSLTTAFGFLSLGYADIRPFVEFGLFTALGVFYAWFLTIFLLPLFLNRFLRLRPASHPRADHLQAFIKRAYGWVKNRPRLILLFTSLLILAAVLGMMRLQVNAYLFDELKADDAYSQSLQFFEEEFSGIRPLTIYLDRKDGAHLMQPDSWEKLDSLEQYLWENYEIRSFYALTTQVKRLNRALQNGHPKAFRIPSSATRVELITQVMDTIYDQLGMRSILTRDYKTGLIEAKLSDPGSAIITQRNEALEQYMGKLFPSGQYEVRLTGQAHIWDKSNFIITRNLGWGLLTALGLVALLMGLLFRSGSMLFIALVPNLLPLLGVAGLMGWLGIGLNLSTAIIFTIAFGIAVDDTIHFLSRFRSELKKGQGGAIAIKRTYMSTGKAILLTSILLVFGFGLLLFSSFQTTFRSGLFISLALGLAVIADLFLLPILLKGWSNRSI